MVLAAQTEVLIRGLFEVQNEVGLGRDEEDYHRAYRIWLRQQGIPHQSKPPHPLILGETVVHTLLPDFVAYDAVIVELKARPRYLRDSEWAQLFDYLKCRQGTVGLLANMGLDRVHVERVMHNPFKPDIDEDWSAWASFSNADDGRVADDTRETLRTIFRAHGTGYSREPTTKLLLGELQRRGLRLLVGPTAESYFDGQPVGNSVLDCVVIENRVVLVFTALFDNNEFNLSRAQSFKAALGIDHALAVNFGKRLLQIKAL